MPIIELRQDLESLAGLWPGGQAPEVFPVDAARFHRLFGDGEVIKRNLQSLQRLRKRLPEDAFGDVRHSLHWLLRYSTRLFPGFCSVWGEFVNEDWLALVDYHKDFHRDHIVHQPQVALIVQRLLREVRFDCDRHPLADAFVAAHWTPLPKGGSATLQELAAFCLAQGDDATAYLSDHARDLGVQPRWLEPRTPACFRFWHEVLYNAAITAALYHDIGYPMQFLHNVARTVQRSRFADLIQGGEVKRIHELFDDPLCLMPFRGYRSSRQVGLSHAAAPDVTQAITRALRESHGLPGALTFLYLNHEVMDVREPACNAAGRLTIELAAMAIVMHDMQRTYLGEDDPCKRRCKCAEDPDKRRYPGHPRTPSRPHLRIRFRRDPVSFVVALADLIQSYGRFHADFALGEDGRPMLKLVQQVAGCRIDYKADGSLMEIFHLFERSEHWTDCLRQQLDWGPNEEADNLDPEVGYLDYSGLFDRINLGATLQ